MMTTIMPARRSLSVAGVHEVIARRYAAIAAPAATTSPSATSSAATATNRPPPEDKQNVSNIASLNRPVNMYYQLLQTR